MEYNSYLPIEVLSPPPSYEPCRALQLQECRKLNRTSSSVHVGSSVIPQILRNTLCSVSLRVSGWERDQKIAQRTFIIEQCGDRRHNERGVSWLMTQKCPSQLRSEYQQRQEVSCPLRIGELSLEIVLPEPEGNIGFVSWDLMSSTMDCGKRKLCVTPLGEVTSNLTVDIIDLPGVA
jgi:hypothetical protein